MGTNNLDNPDFKGKTPLHRVIESLVNNYTESNLSCLKLLLEKRAFVNARDVYGDTPLHLLAELISDIKCDVTAVNVCLKLLLKESSLDVDSVNKSERTALQVLSSQFETNCSTDDKRYLDFKSEVERCSQKPKNNLVLEYYIARLMDCLTRGNGSLINEGLMKYITSIETKKLGKVQNRYLGTETILYLVVESCDLYTIDKLILLGCDPWIPNVDGRLPLHAAISRCDHDLVILLLQHMKLTKKVNEVNLLEHGFSLIQSFLCNCDTRNPTHIKCLEILLTKDILIDINETANISIREGLSVELNLWNLAVWAENEEAAQLLKREGCSTSHDISPRCGKNPKIIVR